MLTFRAVRSGARESVLPTRHDIQQRLIPRRRSYRAILGFDRQVVSLCKIMYCSSWLISRFTDPLKYGDYPQLLKDIRGDILPKFTEEEKALVKGSTDFLA